VSFDTDDAIDRRSGLEYALAQVDKEPVSAFARLLGFRVTEAEAGAATVTVTPCPDHLNVGGTVHGGFLSALMDYATGMAAITTLEAGFRGVHAQATYSFIRAAIGERALTCHATCNRASRAIGHLSCEIADNDGRLIATGSAAMAIVKFDRPKR
jgi:acyl-CoA thioesterase